MGQASTQAGYLTLSYPLDTKSAFFHGTLHSGSVSKIVDRGIDLFFWNVWLRPVKDSPLIGAGCNAVPATDAPVVVDHDDTIRFLPGGVDRTYFHTGRLLTLLALNGKIDESFFRNQVRVIVMFRVFKVDQVSSLESENPDPLKLRIMAGLVILFHTGVDASSAPNASGKLQAVCPKGIGNRLLGADLKFSSIFLLVSLFQLCNDTFLFFRCHFPKMFLQEILGFFLGARGENGERSPCRSGQGKIA